ncbi:Uma2 family endonuclease [Capnocytophaga granulosa]|uniref:Uma2 family endonuclease n=1 Tax=Capnocytophaga granulosa TaxID=45242 RepID=UPI0028EF17CD|nr:Uma2 family endonuclease [Capnocytophaga granulosa]
MSTVITNIDQLDLVNGIYTYADYLMWKIKDRLELLKGKIFQMGAPSLTHQTVSMNFSRLLSNYFYKTPCKLFAAPFDVRLAKKGEKDNEVYTVVQPDLCVVCDADKLDERGCWGAPDLIIEILSPGNSKKEIRNKYELYQEAGVREYWVIRPDNKEITQFVLENGQYRTLPPIVEGDLIHSTIFPDLSLQTEDIFRL